MSKYEKEIKRELIRYACEYLLSGKVGEEISGSFFPEGIEEKYTDLTKLLNVHFIIHEDVVNFVEHLTERIRRIRTETKTLEYPSRGLIKGRINWAQTLKERYSTHIRDKSFFICSNPQINYNLPENLLLKKILVIIYQILCDYEEVFLDENYAWVKETWGKGGEESEDRILKLKEVIEKNVHINRIDIEKIIISERIITAAENSRHLLYKEAATLYRFYEGAVITKNPMIVKDLLSKTLVIPEKSDQIYQVYVFFKTLAVLDDLCEDKLKLSMLARGRKASAEYVDDEENLIFQIFYDTTKGSDFEFKSDDKIWKTSKTVLHEHYGSRITDAYTGRPDIIIKDIVDSSRSIIFEVKDTSDPGYTGTGVRECVQYLKRMREGGNPLLQDFGSGFNGVVVIKEHPSSLEELDRLSSSPKVKIFDYQDLIRGDYKAFLKKALGKTIVLEK